MGTVTVTACSAHARIPLHMNRLTASPAAQEGGPRAGSPSAPYRDPLEADIDALYDSDRG